MPRISNEEKQRKQQELNSIVLELFLSEGIHAITYTEVAKRYNTTKSAIQRYYPAHSDFVHVLDAKLLPLVIDTLDWKTEAKFIQSWKKALNDETCTRFRKVIEFLFADAVGAGTSPVTFDAVAKLRLLIRDKFDDDSIFYQLMGESFSVIVMKKRAQIH
ncbi:TetR/AcrR family transcriptional regulator [Vibrio makurazakiensis]|uniref:hypothetical protein n=1 Tax=Vibrio makurazakiensis TaxID=2910250 RepID=UPI003D0B8552